MSDKKKYADDDFSEKACIWRLNDEVFNNIPFGGTYKHVKLEVNLLDLETVLKKLERQQRILRAVKEECKYE